MHGAAGSRLPDEVAFWFLYFPFLHRLLEGVLFRWLANLPVTRPT